MRNSIPTSLANGRYQVGDLIGHGGMAEVHIALDTRLGRTVAVKIMRSDLAQDAIFLARFRREAHSVAMLNNANIVSIYDSGEEPIVTADGRQETLPYLVMEYVKGQTLRDVIKANGPLSQRDAEQVIMGVLNALEYSHRMGIIHRDIKPGNIMISDQGIVKVMDFGIARALDDSAATMTQAQGVVGTAQYLSPEQARGENVDMRSDLYSAGCVLYEMLTGRPPFTGDSPVAIAYQHVSEVATPPSALVPGLPKIWDSICAKALAKNRQNRYSTATEFKHDIAAMMNGGAVNAAAFNPLNDLATTRTRTLPPETPPVANPRFEPAGAGAGMGTGESTEAYNPLAQVADPTGTQPPVGAMGGNARTMARQAEAAKKRKRNIIIGSIVGAVALLAIIIAIFIGVHQAEQAAQMVTVPELNSSMSKERIQEKIKAAGLVFQEETDNDSTEPEGTYTKQDPVGGTTVQQGSTVRVWFSAGPQSVTIPDLSDQTESQAKAALEKLGLKVGTVSQAEDSSVQKGHVIRTDPASGTEVDKGSTVNLYVATGKMTIPTGITGMNVDAAKAELENAGFQVSVVEQSNDSVAAGTVISVNPSEGSAVDQGTTITLTVSKGKEQVNVPSNLVGLTLADAKSVLSTIDVTVQVSGTNSSSSIVIGVTGPNGDLSGGGTVDKGATVTLTVKSSGNNTGGTDDNNGGNTGGTTGGTTGNTGE